MNCSINLLAVIVFIFVLFIHPTNETKTINGSSLVQTSGVDGGSLRLKPQAQQVWEVDHKQLEDELDESMSKSSSPLLSTSSNKVHLGASSPNSSPEFIEESQEFGEDDLIETNMDEVDSTEKLDGSSIPKKSEVGLCVKSAFCEPRDGSGLIEPRLGDLCPPPRKFCTLSDLSDSYPTCGISRFNLMNVAQNRVFSPANNESVSAFGEWPWVAILMERRADNKLVYLCNGVLLDRQHVVTVAHCFEKSQVSDIVVRLGEHNPHNTDEPLPHTDIEVDIVVLHPEYNGRNLHNDIALVRLKEFSPESDAHIAPVCLPNPIDVRLFQRQTHFPTVTRCFTVGWTGALHSGVPRKVLVPLVDKQQCQRQLRRTKLGKRFRLHAGFVCAGGEEGLDSCVGDGGSPLMCQQDDGTFALVGLVSWGVGCGRHAVPGVYTNIVSYLDFIDDCKRFIQTLTDGSDHFENLR